MRRLIKSAYSVSKLFGIDPLKFINSVNGMGFYWRDYSKLKKQRGSDTNFEFGKLYPILDERYTESGTMSGHYFHQDLFVARKLFLDNPNRHIDIGSRIDGFVAHVASFREIEIIDIREQKGQVKNILFRKADLMTLPEDLIESCDSISSLNVIEHFGLGRYDDPIDYLGYQKAIENITKILQKGGKFYFSVHIGKQRIEFNAHRIFSVQYLLDLLKPSYDIKSFSYVDDNGSFFEEVKITKENIDKNYGCQFGCGIFELQKKEKSTVI